MNEHLEPNDALAVVADNLTTAEFAISKIASNPKDVKFEDTQDLREHLQRALCAANSLHQWRKKNTTFGECNETNPNPS